MLIFSLFCFTLSIVVFQGQLVETTSRLDCRQKLFKKIKSSGKYSGQIEFYTRHLSTTRIIVKEWSVSEISACVCGSSNGL